MSLEGDMVLELTNDGDGGVVWSELGDEILTAMSERAGQDIFAEMRDLAGGSMGIMSSGEFPTNQIDFNNGGGDPPILSVYTPTVAPTTPFYPTQQQQPVPFPNFNDSTYESEEAQTAPRAGKRVRPDMTAELYPNLARDQYSPTPSPAPTYPPMVKQESMIQEYLDEAAKIQIQVRDLKVDEKTVKDMLTKAGKDLKALALPIPTEVANSIDTNLKSLLTKAETDLGIIQELISTTIIEPKELHNLSEIKQELYIHVQQLRLYLHELQYLRQSTPNSPVRGFACLVVSRQPFPKTIKQLTKCSSAGEDPVTVAFIRGAKTEVLANGKVKCTLMFDDHSGKKQTFEIQNDVVELDGDNNAVFSNLRFPSGTRMKPVRLQFTLDVKYSDRPGSITTGVIESDASAPFIVVTNESQWFGAAGALLKKDAFQGGRTELSWQHFANILQFHYLRATRQPTSNPQRPLSREELNYFQHEKFGGKEVISQKDFDRFWEWFGKVLYKVRHQKHFCPMWVQGYVYGFLTKFEAEQLLSNEPPGTFVLRFSERAAGKVAVAFVKKGEGNQPNKTTHYLIDPHNCEGKDSVTLPEFLTPHAHFLFFLQLDTNFFTSKMSSKRRVPKMEVLKTFFMGSESGLIGYEPELS